MKIIGWAGSVNQRVIEETTLTIGEGGTVTDNDSNGYTETRATSLATPDTYQVVMDFDWAGQPGDFQFGIDEKGFSEYDRFIRWYKFVHKKGANPFWFPAITKQNIQNLRSQDHNGMCLYKITSALTPQKSGLSMRVSMTWKEVYAGIIEVNNKQSEPDHITAINGRIEVYYKNGMPDTVPVPGEYNFQYAKNTDAFEDLAITKIVQKQNRIQFFFEPFTESGEYEVMLLNGSEMMKADKKIVVGA